MPLLLDDHDLLTTSDTPYLPYEQGSLIEKMLTDRHTRIDNRDILRKEAVQELDSLVFVMATLLATLEVTVVRDYYKRLDKEVSRHKTWYVNIERALYDAGEPLLDEQRRSLKLAGPMLRKKEANRK